MVNALVLNAACSPPAPACLTTRRVRVCAEPRSTCSHDGPAAEQNLSVLPPVTLPLTALSGPSFAAQAAEPVAARPCARFGCAAGGVVWFDDGGTSLAPVPQE